MTGKVSGNSLPDKIFMDRLEKFKVVSDTLLCDNDRCVIITQERF